jgi:hypothetical protein
LVKSIKYEALYYAIFSSIPLLPPHLGPNNFLNTPLSKFLSLYSSPKLEDQVSNPEHIIVTGFNQLAFRQQTERHKFL